MAGPWLAAPRPRGAASLRPVGGEAVISVAAEAAVDEVTDAEEVVEAVAFDDLAILRHRRVDRDSRLVEIGAQVPLALIGGVIAEIAHAMADRLDRRRHVGLPEIVEIVEGARVLDVLARIDDRPGGGAHAGGGLMIGEGDALRFQKFARRNRERPLGKEVLLIDKDEQDVVAGGRRVRRLQRRLGRSLRGRRKEARAKQRDRSSLQKIAARGPQRGASSDMSVPMRCVNWRARAAHERACGGSGLRDAAVRAQAPCVKRPFIIVMSTRVAAISWGSRSNRLLARTIRSARLPTVIEPTRSSSLN